VQPHTASGIVQAKLAKDKNWLEFATQTGGQGGSDYLEAVKKGDEATLFEYHRGALMTATSRIKGLAEFMDESNGNLVKIKKAVHSDTSSGDGRYMPERRPHITVYFCELGKGNTAAFHVIVQWDGNGWVCTEAYGTNTKGEALAGSASNTQGSSSSNSNSNNTNNSTNNNINSNSSSWQTQPTTQHNIASHVATNPTVGMGLVGYASKPPIYVITMKSKLIKDNGAGNIMLDLGTSVRPLPQISHDPNCVIVEVLSGPHVGSTGYVLKNVVTEMDY
jgi:hypothetical protein